MSKFSVLSVAVERKLAAKYDLLETWLNFAKMQEFL